MGTLFKIVLYAPDEATADRASKAAFARIAELTQNVITAAQDFALHRQGRVLATVRAGSHLVVVGVTRGRAPSGALGRLEHRPTQLG